jgi:hypothetical protein
MHVGIKGYENWHGRSRINYFAPSQADGWGFKLKIRADAAKVLIFFTLSYIKGIVSRDSV